MTIKKRFKGDIIILDPANVVKSEEDWQLCKWGEDMHKLGFENFMSFDTGDEYECRVMNTDTNELMGKFCTDCAWIVILYFDELMKYNPDFDDDKKWPNSNTIIKNFDGEIEAVADREEDVFYIIGKGNINFKTEIKD